MFVVFLAWKGLLAALPGKWYEVVLNLNKFHAMQILSVSNT